LRTIVRKSDGFDLVPRPNERPAVWWVIRAIVYNWIDRLSVEADRAATRGAGVEGFFQIRQEQATEERRIFKRVVRGMGAGNTARNSAGRRRLWRDQSEKRPVKSMT
jgi:hypothetical protein